MTQVSRSVSLRGPKFLEGMEYKGNRICGRRDKRTKRVCILPPGHPGPHNFRTADDGGKK